MKKINSLLFLIPLLFFSCDLFQVLEEGDFWAQNLSGNFTSHYRVYADLAVSGTYCNIWVEKDSDLRLEDVQRMAVIFDTIIYPKMIEYFSLDEFTYSGRTFNNTLEFADWLGDGDGKLCILLLDIKDNYEKGEHDAYTAGYFSSYDLSSGYRSNRRDIIYIDIDPGMKSIYNIEEAYKTIAHETQHLMNYAARVKKGNFSIETWLDEGLSSAVEYILMEEHSIERYDWFFSNGAPHFRGLIDKGNNFYVWRNRTSESVYAVMDDYATVYMFFQWLRIQAGDPFIYKKIISSEYHNYNAVLNALNSYPGMEFPDWETLLKTWHAANYINAESGLYGYKGEPEFRNRRIPVMLEMPESFSLYPGEGIYSLITNEGFTKPSEPSNIRYTSINVSSPGTNDFEFKDGDILLTYNINLTGSGVDNSGITTGFPPPSSPPRIISMARSLMSTSLTGPFRIGINDWIRN